MDCSPWLGEGFCLKKLWNSPLKTKYGLHQKLRIFWGENKDNFLSTRKSPKLKTLNKIFEEKCDLANPPYYTNIVSDLKYLNPGLKAETHVITWSAEIWNLNVQEICHLSDQVQAELIADSFSKISNQYNPINTAEICLQQEKEKPAPVIEAHEIYEYLKRIKTNTATVKDDIPAKFIKEFAPELSAPMEDIISCMVRRGEFPNIWKLDMVTPCPKVYPPASINDFKKISGLKNFSKIAENVLGKFLISRTSMVMRKGYLSTTIW